MKPYSHPRYLSYFFSLLLILLVIPVYSQEIHDSKRSKSIFIEFGGSGVSTLSANIDFRILKGLNDGLGMRVGIGGESSKSKPIIGEGETKTNLFTVPFEVNYIFGKKRFSFEIGYSLTYISENKKSSFRFSNPYYTNNEESGNFMVSYIPVGFRIKPKNDGFMLKLNLGPLINYSAANIFSQDRVQFWGGLDIGYTFY